MTVLKGHLDTLLSYGRVVVSTREEATRVARVANQTDSQRRTFIVRKMDNNMHRAWEIARTS